MKGMKICDGCGHLNGTRAINCGKSAKAFNVAKKNGSPDVVRRSGREKITDMAGIIADLRGRVVELDAHKAEIESAITVLMRMT